MVNKYKVVRLGRAEGFKFVPDKEEIKYLADHGAEMEYVACEDTDEDVIDKAKDADIIMTFSPGPRLSRTVLKSLPKCKAIIFGSVGYDRIDVPAATDNNIIVVNNPAKQWCVEEVSNHTLVLLLALARKMTILNDLVKTGRWADAKKSQRPMPCIYGQTLGLIGCGNIGTMTAEKAQCLKMKTIGYDPYIDKNDAAKKGITLVDSMINLIKQSDFVSAHTPLDPSTRGMIGEKEFRAMKPTAFFINTSRGLVVDEKALIKALQEKWIAGAGLDVFEKEPIESGNPLLKMDNVILFPHTASYSDYSFTLPPKIMREEAIRIINGKWPVVTVNREVKPRVDLTD